MDLGDVRAAMRAFSGMPLAHPLYLIFFVTSKCVGKCKHCFYWESINKPESPLTLPEIEKVAGSMGKVLQVTFTGGEPFLREDFPKIVEIFARRNRVYHLGIATSGFHPERVEAGVRKICETCPGSNLTVGLPIEGPEEINDEIRGVKGFYARTTDTLARLTTLKARNNKLTTLVDITASGLNRGRLIETYELIREKLRPDHINLILTRGVPRDPEAKTLDADEVSRLLTLMEEDARSGKVRGYGFFSRLLHAKDLVLRRMALDIYRGGQLSLPCQAGRVAGVIMPEGDVFPCELWDEPIGNLRQSNLDLTALWSSIEARRVHGEIVNSRCSCHHQCFLSNSIFWNLRAWPSMLGQWARIVSGK